MRPKLSRSFSPLEREPKEIIYTAFCKNIREDHAKTQERNGVQNILWSTRVSRIKMHLYANVACFKRWLNLTPTVLLTVGVRFQMPPMHTKGEEKGPCCFLESMFKSN
ncbi:hypothetical protein CEXT_739651 [Caerostris extrusa]|uniref:Uncharacterized protein n=1 Tax=Caerostris extrusa TaxID=172846 RepID=A0AAV4VW77_CAEEX|nr:hypothetical protein CEXT_739651 [Caerostris extrusa]